MAFDSRYKYPVSVPQRAHSPTADGDSLTFSSSVKRRRLGDPPRALLATSVGGLQLQGLRSDGIEGSAVVRTSPGPRCLLWVDGVGGYLVCFADHISFGQAVPASNVSVPILGDLRRLHAIVRRDGESYLIEPKGRVRVDGCDITSTRFMSDGDEINLGESVSIRFRKPHALSGSARIDFLSHHRTHPSADAVLLMADSCVLGPGTHNHVVCRQWSGNVVLYRAHDERLRCRAAEPFNIDGQECPGQGPVTKNSRVSGRDFTLSLEQM